MKPQADAFLEKARQLLDHAGRMLEIDLSEQAGRTAYLAALNAARALIFEATSRVYKKHSTVQGEFGRLVKYESRVEPAPRSFLGRTYNLKIAADYETGPEAEISPERAAKAVADAKRFVARIAELLEAG